MKPIILLVQCDCKKKKNCTNVNAVIAAIHAPKTEAKKLKLKANPIQITLNEIDSIASKKWMLSLLDKNKDLALSFTQHFNRKEITTVEELEKLTKAVVTTVVKNKKNIEQNELKKIIELWSNIYKPIVEDYCNDFSKSYCLNIIDNIIFKTNYY